MNPLLLIGLVIAGMIVLLLAFKLDASRQATGRGLWRMLRDSFRREDPYSLKVYQDGTYADPVLHHRRRRLWAFIPLLALAILLTASLWWINSRDEPTLATTTDESSSETVAAPAPVATAPPAFTTQPDMADPTTLAVEISQQVYPDGGAENVLLSRQRPSVDALVSGALQGLLDGPLLLTASDQLSDETAAEIDRLGAPSVHILGGEQAVSTDIEQALIDAGHNVHRHAGSTGAETAVDIASRHFEDATTAVLAPAFGADAVDDDVLAEALIAGGLAATRRAPVLVTGPDALTQSTAEHLQASAIDSVTVVGSRDHIGTEVMSDLAALGIAAIRVAGEDPYGTAVTVAESSSNTDERVVLLVDGEAENIWPGASIAAVYAGREEAPIVFALGDSLPEDSRAYLAALPTGASVQCMPGVTEAACDQARDLLGTT